MKELVSVVIPCFNQACFLSECIDSVISQTYRELEIIIVNDGSTDNTKQLIEAYKEKDSRIIFIDQENKGLPAARNAGLKKSRGKYFLPLDSDDKLSHNYIELAVNALESHPDYRMFNTNAIVFGNINEKWNLKYQGYRSLLQGNTLMPTGLFRLNDVLEIGGYDENLRKGCEELDFFIRFLYGNEKIYHSDDYLFYYRKSDSLSLSTSAYLTNRAQLFEYIYKKHIDKYVSYFGNPLEILNQYSWAERRLPQLAKRIQELWQKVNNQGR